MLLIFARFQPGTMVIRSWVLTVLMLSLGFFLSGIGPLLPRWTTVIGTNVLLLAAGPILHAAFSSCRREGSRSPDWSGWLAVAATVPAFWYWGLIEPNGICRSLIFSLAAAVLYGRIALLLWRWIVPNCTLAAKAMATLFGVLAGWMLWRSAVLLASPPPPAALKGANPTTWLTVFGYIVIISLTSMCVMWLEVGRLKEKDNVAETEVRTPGELVDYFRNKLFLLWSSVMVLVVGVVSMLCIGYVNTRESEKARLLRSVELTNDACVEHALQLTKQVDTLLRSVRGFYLRTGSIEETKSFIGAIGFDRSVIDNIYLIGPDGRIAIAHDAAAVGRSVADREYFRFHRSTPRDQIFIAPVEPGRVTGKLHFRITRRIDRPDGSFGGLVLATVPPSFFARYFKQLSVGAQSLSALMGTSDRKLRARMPEPPQRRWQVPIESPLWEKLPHASAGSYENNTVVDNVQRLFVYRKVGELPLVMVTGFSTGDLRLSVYKRMLWLVGSSLAILSFTLLLALFLTREVKRREEQKRTEAALRRSEERLKEAQALANIGDWVYDVATGAMIFSDQLCRMTEVEPVAGSVPMAAVARIFEGEDAAAMQEHLRRAAEEGVGWEFDRERLLPSGRRVWHRGITHAIKDDSGKVVKLRGVVKDITRFKRAETELQEVNRRWTAMQRCGAVLAVNYMDEGRIYFSDSLRIMLGYDEGELDNWQSVAQWHCRLDPEELSGIKEQLHSLYTGDYGKASFEHRVRCKDGSWKWLFVNESVVSRAQDGSALLASGTLADITHIKQMEFDLKQLNDNLMQRVEEETGRRMANERLLVHNAKLAAMGEMIGAIAHQWRQPLATVGVIMQNLLTARRLNKLDEAYLEKATQDATAQIRHLSETIDSFRYFFKPEKAKELFNALAKIEEATSFIRAQLISLGIAVSLPKPDDGCLVNGFTNEFKQVILNLLANARDAIVERKKAQGGAEGVIEVSATRADGWLAVQVRDSGCGIPPEVAARLFEPYYTTKSEGEGTGIGLYMSRQIIEESMGGRLTFTSTPGDTVFKIEVPNV